MVAFDQRCGRGGAGLGAQERDPVAAIARDDIEAPRPSLRSSLSEQNSAPHPPRCPARRPMGSGSLTGLLDPDVVALNDCGHDLGAQVIPSRKLPEIRLPALPVVSRPELGSRPPIVVVAASLLIPSSALPRSFPLGSTFVVPFTLRPMMFPATSAVAFVAALRNEIPLPPLPEMTSASADRPADRRVQGGAPHPITVVGFQNHPARVQTDDIALDERG